MKKYTNTRLKCWITLVNDVKIRIEDGAYVLYPATFHKVKEMLLQLSHEQREVITLRIFGNLSFNEIAKITDVSVNTALGRMRYGLINLRKAMVEKGVVL
jgi:DNA-directed RNA polymerase specialized sigma24 family protein